MLYKKVDTDIYLSIHINWYDNAAWSGGEILYNPINKNNKILGEIMMRQFKDDLKSRRHLKTTDLYMYRNTTIPGILIECGFLSNANERYLLRNEDYQTKLAKTITSGVIKYFETVE